MIPIIVIGLVDSTLLKSNEMVSGAVFILAILIGIWKAKDYRNIFLTSFIFITLAAIIYIIGNSSSEEAMVHKLSDWSLAFLILAIFKLAISKKP